MKENNDNLRINNNENEYITIDVNSQNEEIEHRRTGRRRARIDEQKRKKSKNKKEKKPKKKWSKKKKIIVATIILLFIITIGVVFGVYIYKADGNIAEAVLNVASDVLGNDDPIFVLILGISEDISAKLTDTIILAGYNPQTQQAFMLSIPRDTFIGKNEATARWI